MKENFSTDGEGFLKTTANIKRKRGRPKFTDEQRAAVTAKRDAGKTRKFSVGEEPNKRS